jgi:hypothetical protein
MRRYLRRFALCMASYLVILFAGLTLARSAHVPVPLAAALAILTAAPICGLFWAIFRLLAECDDEYQRLLLVRQVLIATAVTLMITTIWQFLAVYDVLGEGPQWVGVLWFVMFGLAAPLVRLRA